MPRQSDSPIYVVDDDDAVRQALKAMLSVEGYQVRTFDSAESFLAQLTSDTTGCLLLDVRMPGINGLELQRRLKAEAISLSVVIITGHGDVPMAVAALKAGAVDFIEKPFDKDEILAAIGSARQSLEPALRSAGERNAVLNRLSRLTSREREVMDLVVAGHPNKVIAHRLKIALRTVEIHRARVMEKTEARTLSELIRMAMLVEAPDQTG
jgi:two-component system, LuxR family, response regulator FixJ